MKQFFILCLGIISLTACQAPYTRNVYQSTAPRSCVEYNDAFVCSSPVQVWRETVYPKNETQMQYTYGVYAPASLSSAVYGAWEE